MRRKLTDSAGSDDASPRDTAVPLESILCTEELLLRPARPTDYENESRAFVALAKALADSRSNILQLLAETILAVTRCDSSGLSLLAKEADGEHFVRPAIAGVWKPHRGARTPRNCDPSGDVLDRRCALLFRHLQRRYTAFQPAAPAPEECLIVPFYVAGEALGTVWAVMHTDRRRFDREDERVMEALAQFASIAHQTSATDSAGKKSKPQSEEQDFRRIADSIPTLVYTATPGGEVEFMNRQTREYFGCTVEGLKDWGKLIYPDDRPSALNSWRQSLEMGNPWNSEHRLPDARGVYRWFRQRGVPQTDADGRCIRWYMVLTEIDQHKNTEERLRESEAFLLHAQRLSLTGSWKHDLSSGKVSITPEMARIYAVQPHEVATTVEFFVNRIHPEDRPGIESKYARALLDKCDFTTDFRIVLGDGSIRQIHNAAHPKVNERGEVIELRGTVIDVTDQARAKAELRAIINTIPTLAWSANPDGSCDFLNQQWLDFTGLTAEQALGFGWSVVIHRDDASRLLEYWQTALAEGTHVDVEARMRRSDGIYRWFLFRADPLHDESGRIIKWYGTNFDIEDRKRAEDTVRLNERNLRSIINTIPTLSWSTGPDGYVEFLSQRWLDFTGLSAEQAAGFGWSVVIHPDDARGLVEYWQSALAAGTHVDVEARMRSSDGTYRWFLFRADPLRDESGQIIQWYGTNFDIEDRKRAEEALRASEHNLRLIFDTIPALVCTMSAQGELEFVNEQTYDYFGIPLDELKDWSLIGAVHPNDLDGVVDQWRHSVETGERYNIEHRIRRADGMFRWFHVSGLPLRDTDGRIVRWYILLVDSEDRRLAEEALTKVRSELAHVSRVSSLGTLTASIAHEVNQPLAAVIASADSCTAWLASVPPNLDKARTAADRVIRAATQASEVVQRIRIMIKNTSSSVPVVLKVNEVVEEALSLIRMEMTSRRVSLSMDLTEDLPSVFGDRVQIAQVVLNLAMNGIEAMAETGDVERSLAIKTGLVGPTEILVSIADNGPGLNAHVTSRLFEPFFTTKATGMGMGLSISHSIVEAHAGRLWSAKNEPRGAVFHFTLPTRASE